MKKRYSEEQDHRVLEGSGSRGVGEGAVPSARVLRSEFLFLAEQIRRDGRVGCKATKGLGDGERAP